MVPPRMPQAIAVQIKMKTMAAMRLSMGSSKVSGLLYMKFFILQSILTNWRNAHARRTSARFQRTIAALDDANVDAVLVSYGHLAQARIREDGGAPFAPFVPDANLGGGRGQMRLDAQAAKSILLRCRGSVLHI